MKYINNNGIKKAAMRRILSYSLRIVFILFVISILSFSIIITPTYATPTIIPASLPNGQINTAYYATLTAISDNPPVTWQFMGGSLPPGLTLAGASGVISGNPTIAGTYYFYVRASDTVAPPSSSASFSIIIEPPPFYVTTTSLASGEEETVYSAALYATGGTTPYIWSITSGTLPAGLTLDANTGYISGIPKVGSAGTHSFTVTVTDSSSPQRTTTQTISLYIEEGTFAPTVTIGSGLEAGTTKVKIDGQQVASLTGGESMTFTLDLGVSKTVTVDDIVDHPSEDGVRFQAEDDSQVVNETQQNALFDYYTEYYINIVTSPTQVTNISGSGWYAKDKSMTVSAKSQVENNNQTQYRFSYWLLPDNTEVSSDTLNYTVTSPGNITAYYDTYYNLSVDSQYGTVDGDGWYKAGTKATWSLVNDTVPMQGLLGFFQGKFKATNSSGTVTMDSPKTITVIWESDYVLPYILIPLTIVVIILAIVGFYFLLRKPQQQPAVTVAAGMPPVAPRPIPQQHTTVVMIENKGNQPKQLGGTTKDQLIEKFAELLDKYEAEIKTTLQSPQSPQAPRIDAAKGPMISAPIPHMAHAESDVFDGEVVDGEASESTCGTSSKKLLRTVAGKWRQIDSSTITLPSSDEKETEKTGLSITWGRDLYHEWEVTRCNLPAGHKGGHKGEKEIVYSLLNTITQKHSYDGTENIEPPSPHFTESMPELEPDSDKIVAPEELPPDTF
jgi:hypothetical protein